MSSIPGDPFPQLKFPIGDRSSVIEAEIIPSEMDAKRMIQAEETAVSQTKPSTSAVEWFFNAFLKQENIRWLAVVGAAIVIASSLRLVNLEWSHWNSPIKFMVILGYTAITYGFAEFGKKSLGLKVTARVLQFLTLFLLPLTFFSLSWLLTGSHGSKVDWLMHLGLSVPAIGLTWVAASRIFDELWRGRQTSYLASYVMLCIAGGFPSISSDHHFLSVVVVLLYWLIATVGSIKINRHIFWNMQQYRVPHAFGFLPIALLGLQFVALVAIKTGVAIRAEWLGVVVVLCAMTILGTVRTIASVHRQRTGGFLRPMPLHIILPLFIGVAVSLLGVSLTFYGYALRSEASVAVILASILGAGMLFLTARETDKPFFVWVGLVLMMIAYQMSPTLFSSTVAMVKQSAATAVGEDRLPIGFYGLSYLPFLVSLALASRILASKKQTVYVRPFKHMATLLAIVLWGCSLMHFKSFFMVAGVNTALFSAFAFVFRDRRYVLPALVALTIIAGSGVHFFHIMYGTQAAALWGYPCLTLLAFILSTTPLVERIFGSIPASETDCNRFFGVPMNAKATMEKWYGWGLTLLLGGAWFAVAALEQYGTWSGRALLLPASHVAFLFLIVNFGYNAIHHRSYLWSLGGWVIALGVVIQTVLVLDFGDPDSYFINLICLIGVPLVLSARIVLEGCRRPLLRISLVTETSDKEVYQETDRIPFEETSLRAVLFYPLHDLCLTVLSVVFASIIVPWIFFAQLTDTLEVGWGVSAVLAGLFLESLWKRNRTASIAFSGMVPLATTGILIHHRQIQFDFPALGLIWGMVALVTLIVFYVRDQFFLVGTEKDESTKKVGLLEARLISMTWVLLGVLVMFTSLDLTYRIGSVIGLASLALIHRKTWGGREWAGLGIALNLQLYCLLNACFAENWKTFSDGAYFSTNYQKFFILLIISSIAVWDIRWSRISNSVRFLWSVLLRVLLVPHVLLFLLAEIFFQVPVYWIVAILLGAAGAEMAQGIRIQRVGHVWISFGIQLMGFVWIFFRNTDGLSPLHVQGALLGFSVIGLVVERLLRAHSRSAIVAQPLRILSILAPGLVCGLSLAKLGIFHAAWSPWESLILLSSAAIYFQLGASSGKRIYWIGSALIVNFASISLWSSLHLRDPQLYMVPFGLTLIGLVELLKRELPKETHNPIRYVGAMTILVSPMLEILTGSWLHLLTLLVLCVLVVCIAIGLRLRALIYTGTAFLMIDLVAIAVNSAVGHPGLLWIGGLGIGVGVIALAAVCENRREQLLSRIRLLSAELATWN